MTTPTDEQVREAFALTAYLAPGVSIDEARARFDRWLAAHDAKVREPFEAQQALTDMESDMNASPYRGLIVRHAREDNDP